MPRGANGFLYTAVLYHEATNVFMLGGGLFFDGGVSELGCTRICTQPFLCTRAPVEVSL